jgi:hypothetical protein
VDPVADPLLLRKSGSAENRTWTSGSVARNSDHTGGRLIGTQKEIDADRKPITRHFYEQMAWEPWKEKYEAWAPWGPETRNDCAVEDQQQFNQTDELHGQISIFSPLPIDLRVFLAVWLCNLATFSSNAF